MGLLEGTHQGYYEGNDFGGYQFTSLDDVITQFQIAYVGEDKIISKARRSDVAFHAQRALQELSFDTLKSVKSQQIDVPPSLTMVLPHDYVNYTKLSWVDSAGIKHPIHRTSVTSNPFEIKQGVGGNRDYVFEAGQEMLSNSGFSDVNGYDATGWNKKQSGAFGGNFQSGVGIFNGKLRWSYVSTTFSGQTAGQTSAFYQQIDVTGLKAVDISADGVVANITYDNSALKNNGDPNPNASGTAVSTIRFGLTTTDPSLINDLSNIPDYAHSYVNGSGATITVSTNQSPFFKSEFFDLGYVEWNGSDSSTKTLDTLSVEGYDTVYVVAISYVELSVPIQSGLALKPAGYTPISTPNGLIQTTDGDGNVTWALDPDVKVTGAGNLNSLDNLSVVSSYVATPLSQATNTTNSSTWNNYKSGTPTSNQDDYQDDTYWPLDGSRFGLDPQHAQANGSFYIDPRLGRIHFSSNISGKTVILDYISDSLGTDAEMQVHKFAEEAMYKWIAYAILSTRANTQEYIVQRFRKERFAAVRTAKLRLSNIKLEELTQILRGKSKQIKH